MLNLIVLFAIIWIVIGTLITIAVPLYGITQVKKHGWNGAADKVAWLGIYGSITAAMFRLIAAKKWLESALIGVPFIGFLFLIVMMTITLITEGWKWGTFIAISLLCIGFGLWIGVLIAASNRIRAAFLYKSHRRETVDGLVFLLQLILG